MLQKPRALRKNDRVALVAPAGFADAQRIERGVGVLENWGLRVDALPRLVAHRYLSASDPERAATLAAALSDPGIRAVLAVRGGYGSARLLSSEASSPLTPLRDDPKIFVGYSDVTLLLDRIVREAGVVAFHGPMVATDLGTSEPGGLEALERFRRFLFAEDDWFDGRCRESWAKGLGEGPLVGGCLSVLVTTLGTPTEIQTDGAVLFLEDIDERPYQLDRMLTQLRQAGKLANLAGLVLGAFDHCGPEAGDATDFEVLREIVLEAMEGVSCPILFGLDAGHGSSNVVLPLGCRARADAVACEVVLLEEALS